MQSPNRFYYTWRLLFLHHSFAWCVFILLKRSFSPGRTGGFHQLLDKKKKHKEKILVLFLAQKERLDGFSTRRVRFANSLFYVPFCSAKRWTKSSSLSKQIHIYKKKKHKEKILVLFLAQKERLELSRRLPDLRP